MKLVKVIVLTVLLLWFQTMTYNSIQAETADHLYDEERNEIVYVNEAPTAGDDSGSISEDEANTIIGNVLENDTDPEDDSLEVVSVESSSNNVGLTIAGSNGSMKIDANGSWIYIFDNESIQIQSLGEGETLSDSFSYTISDGNETATAVLSVTIIGVNDAPTVRNNINNRFTNEDELFSLSIPLVKFYDVDSNDSLELSASLADSSLPAWLNFEPNTLSGTPANDDVGSYEIKITATDNSGASVDEIFTLSVLNKNDAPFVDLDASNGGSIDYAANYIVGGYAVAIADADSSITEIDNGDNIELLMAVLEETPDGLSENLSLNDEAQSALAAEGLSTEYNWDTRTLTVWGTASADMYQTILRGIIYENSLTPYDVTTGNRTVIITAEDGTDVSTAAKSTVSVITVPMIDLNGASTGYDITKSFTEGDEAVSITEGVIISEPDGDNIDQLVIQLTNAQDSGGESITLTGGSGVRGGITVTYVSAARITMSGTAAPTDYQALLRELQYNNTSDKPDAADRSITVQGQDVNGNWGDTSKVTLSVTPVNDLLTLSANTGITLDEGASHILKNTELLLEDPDNTADELVFTIETMPASGILTLESTNLNTGDIFTQADINAEKLIYVHSDSETTSDSFTFSAVDGSGGNIGDTIVNITVVPVNEVPTDITIDNNLVDENVFIGTIVGAVSVSDPDIGDTHTFEVTGGTGSGLFTIEGEKIKVAGNLDRESQASYTLKIKARDTGNLVCTETFTITINNINDNPPVITSNGGGETAAISVNEGNSTVTIVTAEDMDSVVNYSITDGADKTQFIIDSASGVLTFVETPNFENASDFNNDNIYEVTVEASDGTFTDSQNIEVTVVDINEAPVVMSEIYDKNCRVSRNFTFILPEYTFVDEDKGDIITLFVTLADGSGLPAWLKFDAGISTFSGKPSSTDIGFLNIKVTAVDDAGKSVSDIFSLTINDGNNEDDNSGGVIDGTFANAELNGKGLISIAVPEIEGEESYTLEIPWDYLTLTYDDKKIEISTVLGTVIIPCNMLNNMGSDGEIAGITIARGDKSSLEEGTYNAVGNRPLIKLSLTIDGEEFDWNNPDASVTVSIPYSPTEEELVNPEHIVVWYIDGEGKVVSVPSGRYDPKTKTVTFETTHFSKYAVSYVKRSFSDIEKYDWAQKEIEVLSSKGIIKGTTMDTFSPGKDLTRADYLVLLIRTLGLEAEFTTNFKDINKKAYYYKATGIARKLGIAKGSKNSMFNPHSYITRQDMMVLTERALIIKGVINRENLGKQLNIFKDESLVSPYARESIAGLVKEKLIQGSENILKPLKKTTRAEAAVFLYRIYNMI